MSPRCLAFAEIAEELAGRAVQLGLTVTVNVVSCSAKTVMLHVLFDRGRTRVLEYWPSNGKAWDRRTGRKLILETGWLALDEAVFPGDAAAPLPRQEADNCDAPGRCVKCGEDAPKRFDGLCAGCFSRLLT